MHQYKISNFVNVILLASSLEVQILCMHASDGCQFRGSICALPFRLWGPFVSVMDWWKEIQSDL